MDMARWLVSFTKHLYAFIILFASDPFDLADRWLNINYHPPSWLFWVLLGLAISIAVWLTTRDIRQEKTRLAITRIPKLLNMMDKRLKRKVGVRVKSIKGKCNRDSREIQKLNGVLKSCLAVLGVTKELPKPKKIAPITERYRKSIQNKISQDVQEQLLDKDRNWELLMKIGGILDSRKYGLRLEDDVKYSKYKIEVADITKNYIGIGSKNLTKQKNNYLTQSYAHYSFLLAEGYWGILVDYAKSWGVDNIVLPEAESLFSLRNETVEQYLSDELEKVKLSIVDILRQEEKRNEHVINNQNREQSH